MEKYVFITMNIGGINGAEQYIYNKMNYLKKIGYDVSIFSARPQKILISGFKEYENLVNPTLRFYPYCIKKKELDEVINWIVSTINMQPDDSCTIETSNVISSLWGELIAKKLNCRHLSVIMQENHNYNASMRDFLQFKLDQHELSGIFDDSVNKMLVKPELELRKDMRVKAFCNNSVQDCEDNFSHLLDPKADITIGSIGRLEKEYVQPLIMKLADYFKNNSDKKYNLLLVGGCADKHHFQAIKEAINLCGNVNLVNTDQIYPIPKALLRKADFFVSAAGSAAVSYYEKIPTIKINHISAEPIGIVGYDFQVTDTVAPDFLVGRNLEDCIQLILNNEIAISYIDDFEKFYYERMYNEFERQLKFADEIENRKYYNVFKVKYTDLKYRLCSIVCRTIGVKNTYRCLELIRKAVRGN